MAAQQACLVYTDLFLVRLLDGAFGFQVDADEAVGFATDFERGIEDAAVDTEGLAVEAELRFGRLVCGGDRET